MDKAIGDLFLGCFSIEEYFVLVIRADWRNLTRLATPVGFGADQP